MKELVVATKNKGKLREIKELLKGYDFEITSLADYPNVPEIIEDGKTFRQNAYKKAFVAASYTHKLTLGEDSGLEVKALGNRPGIYSARFSGEDATDKKNNLKLLRALKGVPFDQREARYRCFVALVDGTSRKKECLKIMSGSCRGKIALKAKGKNGFGYDPLFYVDQYETTFGVLDPDIKAKMSHRAKALAKVRNYLQKDF